MANRQPNRPPFSTSLYLAVALLTAGVAAFFLFSQPGLLNTRGGGDSPFLLQRLHQLETAVRDGHFPARWMPDAAYGYGYPFFNYYAPLAFYAALLFRLMGIPLVGAIKLSQLTAFLLAAWGAFRLAERWFASPTAALLASIAYTLAPFHLVNIYVRGDSIAEFWAMAFYPLLLWAVDVAVERHTRWPLALAYAGLILSHNISAMIFSPFFLLYAAVRWGQTEQKRASATSLLIGTAWGLALAAWFWLPAIAEQSYTQLEKVTADYFSYNRHFRTTDLIQTSFFFDFSVTADLQAFRMGLVQVVLMAAGALALLLNRSLSRAKLAYLLGAVLLATLMITPQSRPLWDHLPLLPYTQFPWRFLSIQAFFGALLIGGLSGAGLGGKRPWLFPALLLPLLFIASLGALRPEFLTVGDDDITAETLAQYEWFGGNIGTTISAEYLPHTVVPRPYTSAWLATGERWQAQVLSGTAEAITPTQIRTQAQTWQVDITSETATILLPTHFWPGWQARLDGREAIALAPAPSSGLMQVTLPQGRHELALWLGKTAVRQAAEAVSLVAFGALLMALFAATKAAEKPKLTSATAVVALLLVSAVGTSQWHAAQTAALGANTLNWDFGEMAYLHHIAPTEGAIRYGNGARLARYDYDNLPNDALTAGDSFAINLTWAALPEGTPSGEVRQVRVDLVSPAVHFYNHVPAVASAVVPLDRLAQTFWLAVPASAPTGLYVPRLSLSDDNRPRAASGDLRAAIALRPVRVLADAGGGEGEAAVADLDVRVRSVTQRNPTMVDVRVAWRTAHALPQNVKYSLRLTERGGAPIFETQFDNQPGLGYQPSVAWPSGAWVEDWLPLYLPEAGAMPFAPPYVLLVQLYDGQSGERLLTRRLGELVGESSASLTFRPTERLFALPDTAVPPETELLFAPSPTAEPLIALCGTEIISTNETLDITLYWEALRPIPQDYTHFVHLLNPATGQPIAQHDAMPRNNTYPTSQWLAGEVVADRLMVPLATVPAGVYPLSVGLYRGEMRLQLVGETGGDTAVVAEIRVPVQE